MTPTTPEEAREMADALEADRPGSYATGMLRSLAAQVEAAEKALAREKQRAEVAQAVAKAARREAKMRGRI